jgi:NAD(P)-dependent dehydrogenase (short-subunit alcohol dehydrogenase family)
MSGGVLDGRVAIVTGASQGFGRAIAEAYVDAGAAVAITARTPADLASAESALAERAGSADRVLALVSDVAAPGEAARVATATVERFGSLQVLVNNAGVYGPKGPLDRIDADGWIEAVTINLVGSMLMAHAVIPHMRAARYGKIVQISGGGATSPLPGLSAYAASKAGVVRLAETLAEELREDRIDVNSVAPGALNTRLLDEVIDAGPEAVGQAFYDRSVRQASEGGAPIERGAALAVYLGSPASDGVTAKLLSALWDPWERLGDLTETLDASDVYTLRRIVPEDRGISFDPGSGA